MSKSILFLAVVSLAAFVSIQSGVGRLGNLGGDLRYEARAGFASLKDAANAIKDRVETAPQEFKALWDDASKDFRILKADVTVDARLAAKKISRLIKTT